MDCLLGLARCISDHDSQLEKQVFGADAMVSGQDLGSRCVEILIRLEDSVPASV